MRIILLFTLLISLQACSVMDALRAFSPSQPAVAVDAQVGDRQAIVGDKREQDVEVDTETGDVAVTTDNTKNESKQQFTGEVKTDSLTINNTNTTLVFLLMLVAIVGWVCPRPSTMWRMFRDRKNK